MSDGWDDVDDFNDDTDVDEEQEAAAPKLVYAHAAEFFDKFLRHAYKRELTDRGTPRWNARWWENDEALMRVEALWRAWEFLRLDPSTGMSVWWRDHADHHMPMLMGESGPWKRNEVTTKHDEPLPHEDPPANLFVNERD